MHNPYIAGTWQQCSIAARAPWDRFATAAAGSAAGSRMRAATRALGDRLVRSNLATKLPAAALILLAILVSTYLAAAALVNGAAPRVGARTLHAQVLQQAAAHYRQARALCQQARAGERNACIAEAHAEENRARAVAALDPHSYVSMLRSHTDAGIDAGDHDSIIIEPACSVVVRGQASLCEIQVKPEAPGVLARAGT